MQLFSFLRFSAGYVAEIACECRLSLFSVRYESNINTYSAVFRLFHPAPPRISAYDISWPRTVGKKRNNPPTGSEAVCNEARSCHTCRQSLFYENHTYSCTEPLRSDYTVNIRGSVPESSGPHGDLRSPHSEDHFPKMCILKPCCSLIVESSPSLSRSHPLIIPPKKLT
ncbi:hypothetical protein K469DRAFT_163076 [Zopfia rhizophila CBS 207.26]|uniref:Uncharacterized protein n=1 Tax=Zopfia rhizophila CBS 207.26 TaxID=1314779 RepID=A0A6A6E3R9_9PEZI|nr:hypothetical protein K469DRAFT_163076 [Zopfia rhizophila CBS 207.26]